MKPLYCSQIIWEEMQTYGYKEPELDDKVKANFQMYGMLKRKSG
jgi:hypothetical protein